MTENRTYLSKKELIKLLGVSGSTVYRRLKDFPVVKLGTAKNSRVLYPRPDIDNFIKDNFMVNIEEDK